MLSAPLRAHGGTTVARVLLVDDDEDVRAILRMMLEENGFEVTEARDGARGLELFRREPFDLVVTDIFMPGRDGLELIIALRRECPGLPVVAISGGGDRGMVSMLGAARVMGAFILEKPFTGAQLAAAARDALAAARE